MKSSKDLIKVAQIGKGVGLKGELKLHIKSDFPMQFKKNNTFYLSKDKPLKIENFNAKRALVKFEGYDTPEEASALTNRFLYTTYEDTLKNCPLEKDEYFWFDLMGAKVTEGETLLGEVENIERFEPNDFLVVKTDDKLLLEGYPKTFLIPYIERYIVDFDKDKRVIHSKDALDILKNS